MISRQTAQQTKKVIEAWALEEHIAPLHVLDLLQRIGQVPGNKSFEDSVRALIQLFQQDIKGG